MISLRELLNRLRDRLQRERLDRELREELHFHARMLQRDQAARGLSQQAAQFEGRRRLGSPTRILEAARDVWGLRWFDDAVQDLRFAIRSLLRSPGWVLTALTVTVLGVGTAAVVFSVVHTLLIHPVNYPAPDRIAVVRRFDPAADIGTSPTADDVDAWRRSAQSIEAMAPFARRDVQLVHDGVRTVAAAVLVDTGFLTFTGARPIVGRFFTSEDMLASGQRTALLGEAFWRAQFGAHRDVVGSAMRVADGLVTIVGILPQTLQLPDADMSAPDVWLPLVRSDNSRLSSVAVRLRAGTSRRAAEAELDSIVARAHLAGPGRGFQFVTRLMRPAETLRFADTLLMLSGAVALLLVVACANIAHLMLVRGASRERELALRHVLGAGRWRIMRQIITESLVVTGLGCGIALPAAFVALRFVAAVRPANLTALSRVAMNGDVVASAIVFSILSGVAFGLLAGGRAVRAGLAEGLRGNGGLSPRGRRLQTTFIISEIALSATLLVSALTLVRGIVRLDTRDTAFDARGLFALTVPVPDGLSQADRNGFEQRLIARGRALKGVRTATLAGSAPPNVTYLPAHFQPEGRPVPQGLPTMVTADAVAPGYFATLGVSLVAGRSFDALRHDSTEAVINEAFAQQLWQSTSPLGKRFRATDGSAQDDAPWLTVVGVTRNAVMHGLLEDATQPAMYLPRPSWLLAGPRVTLLVRVSDGASSPVNALQRLGSEIAGESAIPRVVDVDQAMSGSIAAPRFTTIVLSAFALIAVVLAMVGLYGVISFVVAQRTREIGIRIALGATDAAVARLVLGRGLTIAAVGVLLGAAGAIGGSRVLAHSVDGISGSDVGSFVLGATALLAVSFIACAAPMMRATSVDPVVTLRSE